MFSLTLQITTQITLCYLTGELDLTIVYKRCNVNVNTATVTVLFPKTLKNNLNPNNQSGEISCQ